MIHTGHLLTKSLSHKTINLDGITIIYAVNTVNNDKINYEYDSLDSNIDGERVLLDVLNIGKYIDECIDKDTFVPMNYFDSYLKMVNVSTESPIHSISRNENSNDILLKFKSLNQEQQLKIIRHAYNAEYMTKRFAEIYKSQDKTKFVIAELSKEYLLDSNFSFMNNESHKQTITKMLVSLFDKYGYWGSKDLIKEYCEDKKILIRLANDIFPFTNAECTADICTVEPVGLVAMEIYNIYCAYLYPSAYSALSNQSSCMRGSPLAYTASFTPIYNRLTNQWYIYDTFNTLRTFSKHALCEAASQKQIFIKTCEHCNSIFASSFENAKYCTGVCRNRANVKRSYERKKNKKV